jgi:MerR family transcriptional regulator, light-induced transcriptional regulator
MGNGQKSASNARRKTKKLAMHRLNGNGGQEIGRSRVLDCDERRFASQFLMSGAVEIAEAASQALCMQYPDTAKRFGSLARDRWKENYIGRLADLAAAVMAGRSEVFSQQVQWSRVAFEARGVPTLDLERSLRVLALTLDRELPDEDKAPALHAVHQALQQLQQPAVVEPPLLEAAGKHGELAARYLLAILEGDRVLACEHVLQAVRGGTPATAMYEHVLVPVQAELGRMWHLNELTVAEEHFATATSKQLMSQLLPHLPRKQRNGKVLLAASVEGNSHDVGLQMVSDYFEMEGFRSVFLGPSVPANDLVIAVDHFSAHVVALSAALPTQLTAVEATVQGLRSAETEQTRKVKVIVGGPAFSHTGDLWREIGADALCASPGDALATGKRLLGLG